MKYSHRKQLRINKKKFRDVVWELTYRKFHRICRLRKNIIEEIKTLNKNKSECLICFTMTNNKTNNNNYVCLNCVKKQIEEINDKNISECSICFELTNNKTNCNHDVCLICLKKINKCPLCRRDLFI